MTSQLRAAGAILIGKTNMPPMAAGGVQRGLYGRAESPYNPSYLVAAFGSGSSTGAASATTTSMAAFGMGGETVSSGRSPASNNGLVCYTPSKGVISCRGVWALYVSCDVLVPYTKNVEDMVVLAELLSQEDPIKRGDFMRSQSWVKLPALHFKWNSALNRTDLKGLRIGVPRIYIGGAGEDGTKPTIVSPGVIALWNRARVDLEALGAEIVLSDFPLVTRYEDDRVSGDPNNVVGLPAGWSGKERNIIIAKAWDDFLKDCGHPGLASVDPALIFPKPENYLPDTFAEKKNAIDYPGLVEFAKEPGSLEEISGWKEALPALEAQRKRDFEDWLDAEKLDFVVFPSQGDVGRSDVEENLESARYAMSNGVKYSNGNRVLRHLGVPTVSVCMGIIEDKGMPVNLTFAGKAYADDKIMGFARAYELGSKRRIPPPAMPVLESVSLPNATRPMTARCEGRKVYGSGDVKVYVNGRDVPVVYDGEKWETIVPEAIIPPPEGRVAGSLEMVLVVGVDESARTAAEMFVL
jgi:Asp-tRNA(Asn)/Glu-tRNA(Gln) amidotransferase A subunit family amidase